MRTLINHIRQSLSLKLSFSVILMTVPIFILVLGILFEQSRDTIKQKAIKRASSALNKTTMRAARELSIVEDAINTNAWLVVNNFQPDSLLTFSRLIVQMNFNVNGCSISTEPGIFPQYGRHFSAYSVRSGDSIITVKEGDYEYFEKTWYKEPVQLGVACWVDPFDDDNEGTLSSTELIASYSKPLFNKKGRLLGVLSGDYSLPKLAKIITADKPYPNAYFVMLGREGHYFVHPDSTRLKNQTIFSLTNANEHPDIIALGHEMITGAQGAMPVVVDGKACMACYRPIPGTSWSLALICPNSDIFSDYNRLSYIVIPLIFIGLIVIFLICYQIVAISVRPLNQLLEQSQQIAKGDFSTQIKPSTRRDAIGRLQNSFVLMQKSINKHLESIQQVNDEAEKRNEELQQAKKAAIEATKQKTLFIQNMTHQIRTPLNIIMGFAQVLRDNLKLISEKEKDNIIGTMDHNAMMLNRMVLMLYDSSDTGLSEELACNLDDVVECNDLARECIVHTKEHFPDMSIKFATTLPDDFTIHSNKLYLMRSIRELLYNTAKFSDKENVKLSISRTETTVYFIIEDTGPGIKEDVQEQIFEPFTKLDSLSEGLGLGLPLSKHHALTLGGNLKLDKDYHKGCRFIFELPIR